MFFRKGDPELGFTCMERWLIKSSLILIFIDEPCAYKECGFGESCVVENGHGICRCPEKCSSTYSPICGSDEVSYVNECHLRRFACQHQAPIRIKRIGECG